MMMARKVPSSKMPLPQESLSCGSSSGNNPYLDGPKNAPCVQTRKMAASANFRLGPTSAAVANNMTPTSNTFVQMVTARLLNRSARYPPISEKRMKGAANSTPTSNSI